MAVGDTKGRVQALDAVRGVAILGVIATHSLTAAVAATGSYAYPPAIFNLFSFAQFGVPLFFALSGWLMFSLYTGDRPFSQKVYWSRRIARIWPLWLIFIALSYWAYGLPASDYPIWLAFIITAVFLGWTSSILVVYPLGGITIQQEMGHYLLFSLFRKRSVAFFAMTVIVGYLTVFVARFIQSAAGPGTFAFDAMEAWIRLSLFHTWPFFLLGGAGFVLMRKWKREGLGGLVPERSWTSVIVLIALMLAMLTTYAQETPAYFVVGFVLMSAVIAVVGNNVPVLGPVLRSIGKYSYFIYFFHFFVLRWLEARYRESGLPGDGATTELQNIAVLLGMSVISLGVSWVLGIVSWNLLEKRLLALAHRSVPARSGSTIS